MKLHHANRPCMGSQRGRTANRRISNIELQNFEGRDRFAQSFYKIDMTEFDNETCNLELSMKDNLVHNDMHLRYKWYLFC